LLKELLHIFYPEQCITCGSRLVSGEKYICTHCRDELPETDFIRNKHNLLEEALQGRVPFEDAAALFFYRKKGKVKTLIHALKYKKRQDLGIFFARWIGNQLNKTNRFKNIDVIIKVPLHKKRLKERGYNQLTVFANELSKEIKVPVKEKILVKLGQSSSQTKKGRLSRFEKINERFHIVNTEALIGKHILLVDDVFTTGATIEACAMELLKTPNLKISIITMAVSEPY
jgi:ComF family protein